MTKKNIIFLIAAFAVITGLIAYLYPGSNDIVPGVTVSVEDTESQKSVDRIPDTEQPAEVAASSVEPVAVELGEEQPILGQFVRVREVKEKQDEVNYGVIRDLEFVFREGILPGRLFDHNNNIIKRYDQLYTNEVGAGAVTILFYYEVITTDTNGDGVLSNQDAFDIAVSLADGSKYITLASNVDKVFVYEQIPAENALRITLQLGNQIVKQTYSLATKKLESEEQIEYIE